MDGAGERDGVDIQGHTEGQPAATLNADAHEGSGRLDPAPDTKPRRKRRTKRRRTRRVAPAEPSERAAAAAAAREELGIAAEPAGPEAPGDEPELPAVQSEPAAEPTADEIAALGMLAAGTVPILRVATKLAALGLRGRFPGGAAGLYARAAEYAAGLEGTIGLRLAARFGGVVPVLGLLAELAEPFVDDRWAGAAAGR